MHKAHMRATHEIKKSKNKNKISISNSVCRVPPHIICSGDWVSVKVLDQCRLWIHMQCTGFDPVDIFFFLFSSASAVYMRPLWQRRRRHCFSWTFHVWWMQCNLRTALWIERAQCDISRETESRSVFHVKFKMQSDILYTYLINVGRSHGGVHLRVLYSINNK